MKCQATKHGNFFGHFQNWKNIYIYPTWHAKYQLQKRAYILLHPGSVGGKNRTFDSIVENYRSCLELLKNEQKAAKKYFINWMCVNKILNTNIYFFISIVIGKKNIMGGHKNACMTATPMT